MARRRGIGLRRPRRKLWSYSCDLMPEVPAADLHQVVTPSINPGDAHQISAPAEGLCTPETALALTQSHPERVKSPGQQQAPSTDEMSPPSQPASRDVSCDDNPITSSSSVHTQPMSSNAECTDLTGDAVPSESHAGGVLNNVSRKRKSTVKNKSKKTSRQGTSTKKTKNRTTLRCKPNCLAPTASSMIRCSVCMAWYHTVCCGEDAEYTGVWSCDTCRTIPVKISKLAVQITELTSQIDAFQCRIFVLSFEIQQSKSDNGILKSKLANAEKLK